MNRSSRNTDDFRNRFLAMVGAVVLSTFLITSTSLIMATPRAHAAEPSAERQMVLPLA